MKLLPFLALTALVSPLLGTDDYELPPVRYSDTTPKDGVAAVAQKIASGELKLPHGSTSATPLALLKAFGVPMESQVLVFSKTSKQRALINPQRPRALWFSQDCYIGWVPGGACEVVSFDPVLGATFYLFDGREDKPVFQRDNDCLSCHAGSATRNVPGLLVRSVFPDSDGGPILTAGTFQTTDESPLAERWGGWYVTGRHGHSRHMGNAIATAEGDQGKLDRESGANRKDLAGMFDTEPYPLNQSDIVALMTLEHQCATHNALLEANLNSRLALHRWADLCGMLKEDPGQPLRGSTLTVIEDQAGRILQKFLFCREAELPVGGIRGVSSFQDAFEAAGPRDKKGRTLREFDLRRRLFVNRCSYLIYCQAFENLTPRLRDRVLERLHDILTAPQPPADFAHLGNTERQTLREIISDTVPRLPACWKK